MLFQSSIRKELARAFGATLVVLITIVMTIVLIRTLGQASRGSINPQDVMLYMAYSGLGRLPTILTISLFIAMVSTLTRMYRDSEMVVWFTSGQGLAGFLRPLFHFAWPVLLVITLMALFVWPWTNQQTKDMQSRYQQRGDLDRDLGVRATVLGRRAHADLGQAVPESAEARALRAGLRAHLEERRSSPVDRGHAGQRRDGIAKRFGCLLGKFDVAVPNGDLGPRLHEALGDGSAEALCASSDDRDAVL